MATAISALNATLLLTPRIFFGMDGLLPSWVACVNSGSTPSAALLLVAPTSIALVLSGGYEKRIWLSSILIVALYLSVVCALFALRLHEPGFPRPFRSWGYPWMTLAVLLASAAFLVASIVADFKDALFTLLLIALSYPVFLFVVRKRLPTSVSQI